MKSPNHATPSGDREIARLTLKALTGAGFQPFVVSELRTLDVKGDAALQGNLVTRANAEATRLCEVHRKDPPHLWFTYHCHYKAPDLLGPRLSEVFGIPFVISEPSISIKRRDGAWSGFAVLSESAIDRADRLFWTTSRDRPALEAQGHATKMAQLPAFIEVSAPVQRAAPASGQPLQLLAVAMMRPGDKVESYRRLAAALDHVEPDWRLSIVGDGTARAEVQAMFARFAPRVSFLGQIEQANAIAAAYAKADLFVWPGVGEGVGMVYLEAQAAGLPVIAEDHAAPSELVGEVCVPAGDARAFGAALSRMVEKEVYDAASRAAYNLVKTRHSLPAASRMLRETLKSLVQ